MLQRWPGPTNRGRGGSIGGLTCSALPLPLPTVPVIGLRYVDPKGGGAKRKPEIPGESSNFKAINNFHFYQYQ